MNQDEFLKQRVDDQISWYNKKSSDNQWWFKRIRLAEIVAAALIPLLAGYSDTLPKAQLAVGILGVTVTILAGLLGLYKFQENWMEYRVTCEFLKHEKFLFLTAAEPYDGDSPFLLFVQRIEGLTSREHSKWANQMKGGGRPKAPGAQVQP